MSAIENLDYDYQQLEIKKQQIERKFILPSWPRLLSSYHSQNIRQGYLAVDSNGSEALIKDCDGQYSLSVKYGRNLTRQENETEINSVQFNVLWPATEGRRFEKERRTVSYANHQIEIDLYKGILKGLVVAEVKFKDEIESENFYPPRWLGREVIDNSDVTPNKLALI